MTQYTPSEDDIQRFWSKVERGGPDECWEWQAASRRGGYGCVQWEGRPRQAHRISWTLANGAIPDGLFVLHKCDNPRCVNPSHLFLGTNADNARDRDNKGRGRLFSGEKNGKSKLTWPKVSRIRRMYASGSYSQSMLAEMFGVSRMNISYVVRGKLWKE